jgi:hypothetical protein
VRPSAGLRRAALLGSLLAGLLFLLPPIPVGPVGPAGAAPVVSHPEPAGSVQGNFTAALARLVDLVAAGGGSLLALVWARVALSWFSHDVAKKVQARERARDALIGTLVFMAAVTGLVWGLAQWVVTGA